MRDIAEQGLVDPRGGADILRTFGLWLRVMAAALEPTRIN